MDTAPILHWLLTEARMLADPGAMLDGLAQHFGALGYPMLRSNVQVRTQHPEVSMRLYAWRRTAVQVEQRPTQSVIGETFVASATGVVQEIVLDHSAFLNLAYIQSPFQPVNAEGVTVRCRIAPDQTSFEYPLLRDLQAMGATDYLCVPLELAIGPRAAMSWATDRPGGFDDTFLQAVQTLRPALALCTELHSARHITRSLLHAYVGADAGERVLAGQFHRGDVRQIQAAVWFSDLRGFTTLSSQLSSAELVATLNAYFGALAPALAAHGGEVLKYIGDAILAVFAVRADRDATQACSDAVAAAQAATVALEQLNRGRQSAGLAALDHGIGLHFGAAEYGNIGAPGRVDFTVIGRDVNLASRVEGLCGKLQQRLLVTRDVADRVGGVAWRSLGEFELKGIAGRHGVLGVVG